MLYLVVNALLSRFHLRLVHANNIHEKRSKCVEVSTSYRRYLPSLGLARRRLYIFLRLVCLREPAQNPQKYIIHLYGLIQAFEIFSVGIKITSCLPASSLRSLVKRW